MSAAELKRLQQVAQTALDGIKLGGVEFARKGLEKIVTGLKVLGSSEASVPNPQAEVEAAFQILGAEAGSPRSMAFRDGAYWQRQHASHPRHCINRTQWNAGAEVLDRRDNPVGLRVVSDVLEAVFGRVFEYEKPENLLTEASVGTGGANEITGLVVVPEVVFEGIRIGTEQHSAPVLAEPQRLGHTDHINTTPNPSDPQDLRDYKALCDLWQEANAVDTVIGRPEVLLEKIRRLRDDFGSRRQVATQQPAPQALGVEPGP